MNIKERVDLWKHRIYLMNENELKISRIDADDLFEVFERLWRIEECALELKRAHQLYQQTDSDGSAIVADINRLRRELNEALEVEVQ